MTYLYHLFEADGFALKLSPTSLEREGFVHLSTSEQVPATANRWFNQAASLKMLVLDRSALEGYLRWEDLYGRGEEFPHLYGPIPEEAVQAVVRLERDETCGFYWPTTLSGLLSPLTEPVSRQPGVIEPSRRFRSEALPERCLLCFFDEVLGVLDTSEEWECFHDLGSEIGATKVYTRAGQVAVCHPGVGGPMAAATLEELIALGCRTFLLCGGAGSLVPEQTLGHLVVVDRAVRDEGTSHHYFGPGRSFPVELAGVVAEALAKREVEFTLGATWTTDALYRETPDRVARRRDEGCLTVEMELASLLAVAHYRGCGLGAVVYCGDDVGADEWDFRDWTGALSVREKLFRLGLDVLAEV